MCFPAQRIKARAVHELAWSAIRLGGVESDLALVTDGLADGFGNFADADVFPPPHIDVAKHGLAVLVVNRLVQFHDVHAGGGHVIDIQEFPLRSAGAPDGDAGGIVDLGFVEAADQSWDNVGVFRVVVVTGAIEVGGHDAAVINPVASAVLAVVAFAELDAGDLGDGVGLVGGFQRTGEQRVFPHRLWSQLGVDAAGAEEQKQLHTIAEGGVDDIGFHHQILVNELCRIGVVGVNATDLGGGQVDLIGFFGFEEGAHGGLVGEVQLGVGAGDDVGDELPRFARNDIFLQMADDGGTHHAPVASNVNFCGLAHLIGSAIGVFKPDDVVLAQIAARLHFYDLQRDAAGIS